MGADLQCRARGMQSDEACNVILKVVNNVAVLRANFIDGLLVQESVRERERDCLQLCSGCID